MRFSDNIIYLNGCDLDVSGERDFSAAVAAASGEGESFFMVPERLTAQHSFFLSRANESIKRFLQRFYYSFAAAKLSVPFRCLE